MQHKLLRGGWFNYFCYCLYIYFYKKNKTPVKETMHVQPFGHGSHLQNPISVLPSPLPPTPPSFPPPPTFFFSPKKGKKKPLLVKKSLHFFVFGPLPVSRRTLCWAGGTNLCWYPGPEPRFSFSLNIPKGGRTERTELIGATAKIIFPPPPAARPFPNYLVACRATR